ncbi:MAG: hypothetical protein A2138_03040, partial [Deltaproteobacteria bacterium RBG_16_71_12]
MDLRDRKRALGAAVDELQRFAPYAHAFAQEREGAAFRATTRATSIEPLDPVCGAVLCAWNGQAMLEVAVPALDDDTLRGATARLRGLIEREGIRPGPTVDPGAPLERDFAVAEQVPASSLSLDERLARAVTVKDRVHALDARVRNAVARATHVRTQELFVSPTRRLYQDLRRAELVCLVVMEEGGRAADLHGGRGRQGGAEHLTLADDDVARLVEDCARMLGAARVPGGSYRCVFDADVAGLLAHEAFGHGTEADMFVKRRARGAAYLGKRVGSELVDLYDDPSLPGEAASYFFDHEGQLATPTKIIDGGVLVAPMTDLVSAVCLGVARTANGRRESVQRKAYTRMSNTFFGKGASSQAS